MQGIVTIIADLLKLIAFFVANTVKAHWGKMILCLIWTCVFITLLFPYGDLTALVSKQIYQGSRIDTKIDDLGFAMNPSPGIKLSGVEANIATPPLPIASLSIFPAIYPTILNFQNPYGSAALEGFLGGNIEATRAQGDKIPDTEFNKEAIELNVSGLKIEDVLALLKNLTITRPISVPVILKGRIDLTSNSVIDPTLSEQPEIEFNLAGQKLEFPPQSVPTMMGPLSFPKITWSEVYLRGRLIAGELIIEEGKIGKKGDPLFAKIEGKIAIRIDNRGGIKPLPGAYDFNIDLNMAQSVDSVLGLLLTPIAGNYKRAWTTGAGSTYTFRAWGSGFRGLPKTQRLATF
jgi:hypothetical protein